jgi:uncharacterized protein YjbI with pentapeptide repeats
MTNLEFFEAYKTGQRHFRHLNYEYLDGFDNKDFSNVIFENCFLYVNFEGSNLTNAQFISCNIKEIDLSYTNLTNALMKYCMVECAWFRGAIVENFKFIENYYYGAILGQRDFDEILYVEMNQ